MNQTNVVLNVALPDALLRSFAPARGSFDTVAAELHATRCLEAWVVGAIEERMAREAAEEGGEERSVPRMDRSRR